MFGGTSKDKSGIRWHETIILLGLGIVLFMKILHLQHTMELIQIIHLSRGIIHSEQKPIYLIEKLKAMEYAEVDAQTQMIMIIKTELKQLL
jgi:hypothetical protein